MNERKDQGGRTPGRRPAEGVRIIGAEEAQAALEAGEAAGRRPGDQLRFGDVPPAPSGPRPPHRFPLPDSVDPATAVPLPPLAGRGRPDVESPGASLDPPSPQEPAGADVGSSAGEYSAESSWDVGERTSELGLAGHGSEAPAAYEQGLEPESGVGSSAPMAGSGSIYAAPSERDSEQEAEPGDLLDLDQIGSAAAPGESGSAGDWRSASDWRPSTDWRTAAEWRPSVAQSAGGGWPRSAGAIRAQGTVGDDDETEVRPMVLPEEGLTVSGAAEELPHWTDPPTGEVPRILLPDAGEEDMNAWNALGSRGIRWRDSNDDWEDADELAGLAGEESVSPPRSDESDLYSFDEDFERLQAGRSGPVPVVPAEGLAAGAGEAAASHFAGDTFASTGTELPDDEHPPGERHDGELYDDDYYSPSLDDEAAELAGATAATVTPRVHSHGRSRARRPAARTGSRVRPPTPPMSGGEDNLTNRVVIGAGLVLLLIIAYAIGPKALVVYTAVILTAAAAEAYGMLQRSGFRPATLLGLVGTAGLGLSAYWKGIDAIPIALVLVFVGSMLWYLLRIVEARPLANVAVSTMTFVWVGVLGSFAAVMLRAHDGKGLLLGTVVVTVVADVAAFLVGRWIGSRPLAAHISPGKTWEGLAGGLVAAIVAGAIIGKELSPWGGMRHGLVLGLVVGLVAPLGDLFESMMKRDLGLKDSGRMLRAHGGVLDRFDSMLLALPAAYYVAWLFDLVH